jgi:hypothetical protein
MNIEEAAAEFYAIFNAEFPNSDYYDFWCSSFGRVLLDGEFTPAQLRLLADLAEKFAEKIGDCGNGPIDETP